MNADRPKYDFTEITLEDAKAATQLLTPVAFTGAPLRGFELEKSDKYLELVTAGRYHRWRFDFDGGIWCYEGGCLRGVASLSILAAYECLHKYEVVTTIGQNLPSDF